MTSSGETSDTSHLSLTNLILVSLVAGTGLFIVNTVILVSLCYKRSGPRLGPRWDRAGERGESSSTECLSSSQPTTPHLLPTFSTPGRTSSLHSQSVPLSSFPQAVQECGPGGKYRSYSSGGSYVGLSPSLPPPADGPGFSSVPLVADIPAPGAFSGHGLSGKEESITC